MPADMSHDDSTESFVALAKDTAVSHYKIIDKIGSGGMGDVYLAWDTRLERTVAIKFLHPHLCRDEGCRKRFEREAQAAARLDHPNIVTVHEVGEFHNRPYMVMQHVEGHSLRHVIKQGKLSLGQAIDLATQICEGLREAHELGITHRDIKPSNILLDSRGNPKLVDFGLAAIQGTDKLTKTGSTLGTVGYMSPEQAEGKHVDQRSDLFSFGVVLYELITGRRPFDRDSDVATSKAIVTDVPEPLARYKAGVAEELQQIVDRALDKNIETRYQTASGMLADLIRLKSGFVATSSIRLPTVFVTVVVVIIAVSVLIIRPWRPDASPTQEPQGNKLAIMYFDNLADPSDSLKMGEIATNLLITDLSESEYLNVVSSQHLYDLLRQLGGKDSTVLDRNLSMRLARRAEARWILLGKILRTSPHVVITTELIEVSSGEVIAAQRLDGAPGQDVFSLIDALTTKIKNDLDLAPQAIGESDPDIASITTTSIEAYRIYLQAVDDRNNARDWQAVEKLDSCLKLDSTFSIAYALLANAYHSQGNDSLDLIAKAVKYSNQASEKERLYIKAEKAYYEEDFDLAVELLEKLVKRYPDEKHAYQRLGRIYRVEFCQPDKAIAAYRAAINIDPLFLPSYNALSAAYLDAGDIENSLWSINKYVELSDSSANALDTKGEILGLIGNTGKAIETLQLALKIEPNFLWCLHRIGLIHVTQGEYSKARQYFRALVLHEDYVARSFGRLLMARIPIRQGQFVEALQILNDGIAADRMEEVCVRTAQKHLWRWAIYRELGAYDSAMSEINTGIALLEKLAPQWAYELRSRRIELLADVGEFKKAVAAAEELRSGIEGERKRVLAKYWGSLSYIECARTNFRRAVTCAENACAITPLTSGEYWRYHAMLGRAYLNCGRLGDAVAEFEQIGGMYGECRFFSIVESDNVDYWLGMAYEASGWTNKAIKQYETYLNIRKNADEGLKSVEDAKQRLENLKQKI